MYTQPDPKRYLASYVESYLRQEVIEEGRTRNLAAFSRFLESASFSQAASLNVARVARDVGVDRNTAAAYFELLEDLMIASRVPVFAKRAKRRMTADPASRPARQPRGDRRQRAGNAGLPGPTCRHCLRVAQAGVVLLAHGVGGGGGLRRLR